MALLLRRSVKEIQVTRGTSVMDAIRPRDPGLPAVGNDPAAGQLWSKPGISYSSTLPRTATSRTLGTTSPFGEIRISSTASAAEQALARVHELVHQFLTPRFGVLRTFRVQVAISGYTRVALLRYLEEALAQTVALVRVQGISFVLEGIKFPFAMVT